MPPKILVVNPDPATRDLLAEGLAQQGLDLTTAVTATAALSAIDQTDFDAVVTDVQLGGRDEGLGLCRTMVSRRPDLSVVMMTPHGSMDQAIQAVRSGAYDFIHKPVDLRALGLVLERAVKHRRLTQELERLRDAESLASGPHGVRVGHRRIEDSPERIRSFESDELAAHHAPEHMLPLAELERRYIDRVLRAVGGNKTRAAKVLEVDRRTLYRKLHAHEAAARRKR